MARAVSSNGGLGAADRSNSSFRRISMNCNFCGRSMDTPKQTLRAREPSIARNNNYNLEEWATKNQNDSIAIDLVAAIQPFSTQRRIHKQTTSSRSRFDFVYSFFGQIISRINSIDLEFALNANCEHRKWEEMLRAAPQRPSAVSVKSEMWKKKHKIVTAAITSIGTKRSPNGPAFSGFASAV